jgi:hypothetical protein
VTRHLVGGALLALVVLPACAARAIALPAAPPATPAPGLVLNHRLPSEARICVPLETFRNGGVGCITVGELRALLRSRRTVAFQAAP